MRMSRTLGPHSTGRTALLDGRGRQAAWRTALVSGGVMSGLLRPEPSRWRRGHAGALAGGGVVGGSRHQLDAVPAGPAPAGGREGVPWTLADHVSYLVATAGRAPSVHNTQPWWFRVAGTSIELHADPRRRLPFADPDGREMLISCGAALFGLRLAVRELGHRAPMQVLPNPGQPD